MYQNNAMDANKCTIGGIALLITLHFRTLMFAGATRKKEKEKQENDQKIDAKQDSCPVSLQIAHEISAPPMQRIVVI